MMRLYLIRHAQSTNNANIDQPGNREPDPPLTSLGANQASYLAAHFHSSTNIDRATEITWSNGDAPGYTIHRIICSPMQRALQSARPLATALEAPVCVWPDVCERGGVFLRQNGRFHGYPGLTRSAIAATYPGFELSNDITENGWWRGDLEPRGDSWQRAVRTAERLKDYARNDWRDDNVVMIIHAGFGDALLKALLGETRDKEDTYFYFYNTSITRLDFRASGSVVLRCLNRVEHLPTEMVS